MSTKLTQEQKQEQSLSLTPAQIQAIKMLELTGLELEGRIEHELEENPALEENFDEGDQDRAEDDEREGGDSSDQDWELGEYASEDDIPEYKLRELQERQAVREEIPFAAGAPSLDEYLLEQLAMITPLEGDREEIARYIIGNMDEDGYLTRSELEIEDDLLFKAGITPPPGLLTEFIRLIKTLDPAGIGARDLRECLLLQLDRLPSEATRDLAERLIRQHYDDFVNKRFDRLCSILDISEERLSELYAFIARLNPKPAASYGEDASSRLAHFAPDFIVTEQDGELQVALVGERDLPPLRLSPTYLSLLEEQKSKQKTTRQGRETVTFLRHKVEQARWFIDAIQQRQQTLRRTMVAIVAHQRDFFLSGEVAALRPMILKDIAEATGLDISTISRVSNSKSVQTDFGVYMLKFFFGEGITNEEGESISTREVREALARLIAEEDKRHPLSDEQLTSLLAERGYPIARRTVAKYREQLRLPIARLRKEL